MKDIGPSFDSSLCLIGKFSCEAQTLNVQDYATHFQLKNPGATGSLSMAPRTLNFRRRQLWFPVMARAELGFTLIEVIVALSIISLITAVAVPALSRRLEAAFSSLELTQLLASARVLPIRVATLGITLQLDEKSQAIPLSDNKLPLDLPNGWRISSDAKPYFARGGACKAGKIDVTEANSRRHWTISFEEVTCNVAITSR